MRLYSVHSPTQLPVNHQSSCRPRSFLPVPKDRAVLGSPLCFFLLEGRGSLFDFSFFFLFPMWPSWLFLVLGGGTSPKLFNLVEGHLQDSQET